MKRWISGAAAVLMAAALILPCRAISARSAVVMDAQTGRILYERSPRQRSLIASTTKIMTALLICEQCNVLDQMRIPQEAVGIEGSSMYLQEGEVLTLQELLYGLMLHSGNDAAVALAIYCGGTVAGFVDLMNDRSRVLGLTGTHFANPNGLDDPEHYSTARDLAVLAAVAMDNPIFAKTVSTKTVTVGNRRLRNHNKLLWQVEGADGVKTGYTKAAGRILVSSATRQDRRIVAVTIHDPDDWRDHAALLEEAFSGYRMRQVVRGGQVLGTAEVLGGTARTVSLIAEDDFSCLLALGEKPEILLPGPGFLYAPVAEGQSAGTALIRLGGRTVGRVNLVCGETVEQAKEETRSLWDRLWRRTS